MLSLKLFRQTKCPMLIAQRQMSLRALPKCVNQFSTNICLSNRTLMKPLVSSPMIARFTASTAVVKKENNYASVWKIERIISIGLMGLFPATMLYPSPILDTLLAISTSLHVYWGMEALVVDYLRVPVVGQIVNKAGHVAVSFLAVITLAGFLQVIYMGDGLANAIIQLWKL